MEQSTNRISIYLSLLLGMISFGFAPILVRAAPDVSPMNLVTYRTVLAAICLFPYWWKHRQKKTEASSSAKEKMSMMLAGVCLGLHFTCWLSSLYYTSVASASVLVTVHPVVIILVEWLLFNRRFSMATWVGVIMAFSGTVLLGISASQTVSQAFPDPLLGNALAFSAALIFVIYLLIGRQIRQKKEWVDYVFPVYSYAALTCFVLMLIISKKPMNLSQTGLLVGLGLAAGPQILGHGSMNYAVKYISPTLISTLILIEPLLASVLAYFIYNELPPLSSIIAMSIILLGIGFTWKRRSQTA